MANHHFGKLADVWKHLVLDEVLAEMNPDRYAETHAGSATYPMVDDPERRFGVLGFLDGLASDDALARTVVPPPSSWRGRSLTPGRRSSIGTACPIPARGRGLLTRSRG